MLKGQDSVLEGDQYTAQPPIHLLRLSNLIFYLTFPEGTLTAPENYLKKGYFTTKKRLWEMTRHFPATSWMLYQSSKYCYIATLHLTVGSKIWSQIVQDPVGATSRKDPALVMAAMSRLDNHREPCSRLLVTTFTKK